MTVLRQHYSSIIAGFTKRRILVVGDVILDHYLRGSVHRTSPEAPVPVLAVESEDYVLGGAGNVAANIHSLGGSVTLIAVVGDDESAETLRGLNGGEQGFRLELITEPGRPTTVKTRCVSQGQQMLRYDRETTLAISEATQKQAMRAILKALRGVDAVIISDYGKGFLPVDFLARIISEAKERQMPVIVDPKGADYSRYCGATTLTPNQKEASEASGVAIHDEASLNEAARRLQRLVQGEAVVITRGAQGVSVFPKRKPPIHHPARAREVFDVTGAGDTFIATLTLALAGGAHLGEAAEIANLAGGIVVGMEGVVTLSASMLQASLGAQDELAGKILPPAELAKSLQRLQRAGRRIVFTNGFFDLLHHGHLRMLEQARALGDCLVVAINSDRSTRRLKGEPRPILHAEERCQLLAALPSVDFVTVFDEDTPESLLQRLKPDVLVKGAPSGRRSEVVGRSIVEAYGGSIALLDVGSDATVSAILDRALRTKES